MAYSGHTANIPLGALGLETDRPPGEISPGALIRADNVSFETGLITKAPGAKKYNTAALPAAIVAIFDWWPNTVTQRLIAACADGKIYRDIGDRVFSGNVAIASGLGTLTPRSMFIEGGNEVASRDKKLFFLSGQSQVKVLAADQETFATIANPAADWVTPNFPKVGLIHRNRLWAFMGQRAYASDTADHENFTSNYLTQSVYPGEGGEVIGAYVYKSRFFCFKEGGFVYYLDESDSDSDNWNWLKLANNFGLASPHGIVEASNDMIAINESGSPTSYTGVQSFGDIASADILKILQVEDYFRKSTSLNGLPEVHAHYYEAKKQLFFTWRTSAVTTNNLLLHIDLNKQQPRIALWSKDQVNCLNSRKDISKVQRPMYGAADGYVYLMDSDDRLTGATSYTGKIQTSHLDLRWVAPDVQHKNKLFDFLAIEFLPKGAWNISVHVYIDGKFSETITYPMDVRDDGLDTFTLGSGGSSGLTTPSGGDGDPLGRDETQTIQKPLHGSGRRISFVIEGTGSNQNFALASLTIGFRVSAEQATRV
jgi:hypothetical protein